MINQIHIENFTCFTNKDLTFSKGINIFIGKNGTGKTHIMKCLAASMKANQLFYQSTSKTKDKYGELLADKLMGYFKPDTLGHLVNKYSSSSASIQIMFDSNTLSYSFGEKASLVKTDNNTYIEQPHFIYIPPREVFSLFEGFISLYERREISFDETYLDLAKAMDAAPLKNEALKEAKEMIKPILEKWNLDVIKNGNRFYIVDDGKQYEAHLVAEGLRKVATIIYLCINGELKKNSILFWDEPESNLNPTLISIIVDLLLILAKEHGIQIFLSTHDYLLSHKLSLMAEYNQAQSPDMKFFSMYKGKENHNVEIETANALIDIQNNPILQEYAAFFDLENKFMRS